MPFISFAQNLEDVVLYRALRDVVQGFYVDVGANSPDEQSVTRAFYERGWRGINIEPAQGFDKQLAAARPHDINLAVAAGDSVGTITFYDIPGSELSTADADLARTHQCSGLPWVERQVPVDTLDNILAAHGVSVVHFLKIDVEGMEAAVLRGLSLKSVRPWIILVEATVARTQIPNHEGWEPLLTDRGYRFVYFDGLNRFYVAEEKSALVPRLETPPNIFDDWFRAHDWVARQQAQDLNRQIAEQRTSADVEREVRRAEAAVRTAETEARQREARIRTAEIEVRRREVGARTMEAAARAADATARMSETAARRREIEIRRQETESRLRDAELRRAEAQARDREIALRQSELADRAAERAAWRADVDARLAEWQRVGNENAALHGRIAELDAVVASLNGYIEAVRVSTSWRLTAPVRRAKRALAAVGIGSGGPPEPASTRALAVRAARKAARWAAARPLIRQAVLPILLRHPALERGARALLARQEPAPQPHPPIPSPPQAAEDLPLPAGADTATLAGRPLSAAERSVETMLRHALTRAR
ncbi:FkbM family methyltransferase [Skermanella mucosa]|uniref:FkbM family methyltransferase n=1 Tax=Skermanella mucosa TaxID=1789672 RepID=UPI00192BFB7A|nr:FkbM family methyltransferase [Skermanella mucosa]UEM22292.1 FkbM family methyltransferase [Skermanella mucosa]